MSAIPIAPTVTEAVRPAVCGRIATSSLLINNYTSSACLVNAHNTSHINVRSTCTSLNESPELFPVVAPNVVVPGEVVTIMGTQYCK